MSKGIALAIGLILGAAGGSFVTYRMLKDSFAQSAEEEIQQVRDALLEAAERDRKEAEQREQERERKTKEAVAAAEKYSATNFQASAVGDTIRQAGKPEKTDKPVRPPYQIPTEEFDAFDNPFETKGLKAYQNGIIIGPDGRPLDKAGLDALVGSGALTYFSVGDPDRVCIRNEALKTDFEIVQLPCDWPPK